MDRVGGFETDCRAEVRRRSQDLPADGERMETTRALEDGFEELLERRITLFERLDENLQQAQLARYDLDAALLQRIPERPRNREIGFYRLDTIDDRVRVSIDWAIRGNR
jgi:hypothetical protein